LERSGYLLDRGVSVELVVAKREIEVDRQARHVAHEEIDCRAALESKGVVMEDSRRDAHEEPRSIEILRRHGLSTKSPSGER